jgi:uncharacterized protein (TIRG00374 family)
MDRGVLPTGELPALVKDPLSAPPRRLRPLRFTIKALLAIVLAVFLMPPVLTGFRQAADTIGSVNPALIVAGFVLQLLALACYSFLTRASLGTAGAGLSHARIFRIQLSTKALSNIVPGGNAAGSALGYRLLTLSGVSGPNAGFALATAGIGSAVVLNILFWLGLVVSIPIRGVNPLYGIAAVLGVIIMGIAAMLVIGLTDGQGRAELMARWIARKLRLDEDKFAAVLRQVGERMEELVSDRVLLRKVVLWATLNWVFDAASLWMFLRAFGGELSIDLLIVAFGLANVMAAIPILPGGLGVVEGTYIAILVSFGIPRRVVVPAIAAYRSAQYLMPIALGGLAYASLRVGPWKIERRDRLIRLRDLARVETAKGESRIDFALRFQRETGEVVDEEHPPPVHAPTVRAPVADKPTSPPVRPPVEVGEEMAEGVVPDDGSSDDFPREP